MLETHMKRLFLLAGELSGDQLGAWYLKKRLIDDTETYHVEAIGGDCLQAAGAQLYERFEKLNVAGIVEIVRHIPRLFSFMNRVIEHLISQKIDEVVLIDFPGFNLRLARKLKQKNPAIKITYLSPPQLWCWGKWRIGSLKKYTDQVIVLYPFEVAWYRQNGMQVVWQGNPVYDRLVPYFSQPVNVTPTVAMLPGSRSKELEVLLPIMGEVVKSLRVQYPEIKFILPRPSSLSLAFVQQQLVHTGLRDIVQVIDGED